MNPIHLFLFCLLGLEDPLSCVVSTLREEVPMFLLDDRLNGALSNLV